MKPLVLKEITVGMEVVFIDRDLNRGDDCYVPSDRASVPLDGRYGVVVGFGDSPGKPVCVVLKEPHEKAHVCDGWAPDKHGVWARPDHLYTPDRHVAHKAKRAEVDVAMAERDKAHAKAHEIAQKYLGK